MAELRGLSPVLCLDLEALAGEVLALPGGVVGVLDGQWRQGVGLPLREGAVERVELPGQQPHRPAIGDDVVLGEEENMVLIAELDQACTDQGALCQIKWGGGFLGGQALYLLLSIGGLC